MTIPTYLPYFVLLRHGGDADCILYGLNRALAAAAWPATDRSRAAARLGRNPPRLARPLDRACARSGFYHVTASAIPTIQYGIPLPILIGALLDLGDRRRHGASSTPCHSPGSSACSFTARSA